LLRSIYETTKDIDRQIDICNKIVMRMFDEDETVKDLAVKSIEEMWFSSPSSSQKPRSHPSETLGEDKEKMMDIVAVIMGVCTFFKDRQSPLEDMLHSIMNDKIGADVTELLKHYTDICETLIDGLVDASEIHGFVSRIITLCVASINNYDRRLSTVSVLFISLRSHIQPFCPRREQRHYFHM
jgi:cohesin loading factor subunit SCC2